MQINSAFFFFAIFLLFFIVLFYTLCYIYFGIVIKKTKVV